MYTKIAVAEVKNIKFNISIDCSLAKFPLDNNEATSFLGNLIDNSIDAVEYMEDNRYINLEISMETGSFLVEIENPCVLNENEVENILKPNFTTKQSHSGLGLVIVKELVDKYQGKIVVNINDGRIVFNITIPSKV